RVRMRRVGGDHAPPPRDTAAHAHLAHHARHALAPAAHALALQLRMQARRPVRVAALGMQAANLRAQLLVRLRSRTARAVLPGVIPTAGDLQYLTQSAYFVRLPVRRNERELHF